MVQVKGLGHFAALMAVLGMAVAHGEERGIGLLFKDPAGTQVGL